MLNNSYTVGTAPYNWVLTKQFDTDKGGFFNVRDLAIADAVTMSVQHQSTKSGRRSVVDLTKSHPVANSTTNQTYKERVYTVIDRSSYSTVADLKGAIASHIALLQSAGFIDSVLAGEV